MGCGCCGKKYAPAARATAATKKAAAESVEALKAVTQQQPVAVQPKYFNITPDAPKRGGGPGFPEGSI